MKALKCIAGLITLFVIALCAESSLAWDTRWQFKPGAPSSNHGSGPRAIEMKKKFDFDPMTTFKGATDISNGTTIMRNLDGGAMRGYINKDGTGLLRDQNGNFYNVNTRW
jgi:hypothetical protein